MGEFVNEAARLLISLELRASLILVVSMAVFAAGWRLSPAVRVTFLQTALAGSLILPVLMVILPAWAVQPLDLISRALGDGSILVTGLEPSSIATSSGAAPGTIAWLVVAVWLTGVLLFLGRLMVGAARNRRFVQRAIETKSNGLVRMANDVARVAGLRSTPRLVISRKIVTPFAWGRSTVVLPEGFEQWTEDRQRTTLLHEFHHIRRGDPNFLLLAHLASGLHWMNPLVWLTLRLFRNYAERACDDFVIQQGGRASDYAGHLLKMAEAVARNNRTPLSMTLLNKSLLEGRLMRIMSPSCKNRRSHPWIIIGAAVLLSGVTAGAASVQMMSATAIEDEPPALVSGKAATGEQEKLAESDEFVRVETMPEMTYAETPVYPAKAKEKGIEGSSYVQALVGKEGKVLDVKLARSSGNESLDKSAVRSAWKCLYSPALQKGKPVEVWVTYKIDFHLDSEKPDSTEQ